MLHCTVSKLPLCANLPHVKILNGLLTRQLSLTAKTIAPKDTIFGTETT